MILRHRMMATCLCVVVLTAPLLSNSAQPVTPNASPEAKALLNFVSSLSGKYTLTGQHNYPNTRDRNSQFASRYIGETPAVWSTDMGFAEDGDTDSYLARPDIVEEAIRQHHLGSLVTICWHAVPPTANEPVTFRPLPEASPDSLASVQGQLTDQQFRDVLTPGTPLYQQWCNQVDSVAFYLKKLQKAHLPVLWRPYHEMNGAWFWWGGRLGPYGTRALYRQLFDRLVTHHKLDNLVWVWSVDRPNHPNMYFSHYYPGTDYLDILALDVYGNDFNQTYYDSLLVLSNGKPLTLGEVGNPPTPDILQQQPGWIFWVIWAGMVRNTTKEQHHALVRDARILSLEDSAYVVLTGPYRAACQLPSLNFVKSARRFSGKWQLNEGKCQADSWGLGQAAYQMSLDLRDDILDVRKAFIVEWGDDRFEKETYVLDGTPVESIMWNAPQITTSSWSGDTLVFNSRITFNRGDQAFETTNREFWFLEEEGRCLKIRQVSRSFRGNRDVMLVYEKE